MRKEIFFFFFLTTKEEKKEMGKKKELIVEVEVLKIYQLYSHNFDKIEPTSENN